MFCPECGEKLEARKAVLSNIKVNTRYCKVCDIYWDKNLLVKAKSVITIYGDKGATPNRALSSPCSIMIISKKE
jgi:hypothetical protein